MTIEGIKRMLDACYQAKRIRDMLPPLPDGVTPSYLHYLDVMEKREQQGLPVKVSDISDALRLPRPGVTRAVKEMEVKGYVQKQTSSEDGRVTYLTITGAGRALSAQYNTKYFRALVPYLDAISDQDMDTMIRTIETFYQVMCERSGHLDD